MLKKILLSCIVVLSSLSILWFLISMHAHDSLFAEQFDAKKYKILFDRSQWIVSNTDKQNISDSDLYSHMAYEYMLGVDPTTQNFEVPPLGKYLIGGSVMFFNNQRVFSLLSGIATLLLLYYLSYTVTKSAAYSLIAPAFTASSWFFTDQILHAPQLEIFQLVFLLVFMIFFIAYEEKKNFLYLIAASAGIGAFLSIKFFFIHYLLILFFLSAFYVVKKAKIREAVTDTLIVTIIACLVYAVFYIRYFLLHGTLIGFINVQKWIIGFYTVHSHIDTLKLIGSYIPFIYLNQWHFWSRGYPIISFNGWNILWPVMHLSGLIAVFVLFKKGAFKKSTGTAVIGIMTAVYSMFLIFVPVWPRYFLLLYVLIYLLIGIALWTLLSPNDYQNRTRTHKRAY